MYDPMTQLITVVVSGARTGRHNNIDGCLTMPAHIHTRSTRCVIWTVSQSLSEEGADLTASCNGLLYGVVDSAFSWYRMRDLH